MAKKSFGGGKLSTLTDRINETIEEGEKAAGEFVFRSVSLSSIEPDPDNPKSTGLNKNDPRLLDTKDAQYETKRNVLDELEELSASIREVGVEQPLKVYPHEEGYRILFGERRYLASIIAGVKEVPCWILPERPQYVRRRQYIENHLRTDLSTWQLLENIEGILAESASLGEKIETGEQLAETTGGFIAVRTARRYLRVLRGPADVLEAIQENKITSIKAAEVLAGIKDPEERRAKIDGTEQQEPDDIVYIEKPPTLDRGRGRPTTYIAMGKTENPLVVKEILVAASMNGLIDNSVISETDWEDLKHVKKTWKQFIATVEERL